MTFPWVTYLPAQPPDRTNAINGAFYTFDHRALLVALPTDRVLHTQKLICLLSADHKLLAFLTHR